MKLDWQLPGHPMPRAAGGGSEPLDDAEHPRHAPGIGPVRRQGGLESSSLPGGTAQDRGAGTHQVFTPNANSVDPANPTHASWPDGSGLALIVLGVLAFATGRAMAR